MFINNKNSFQKKPCTDITEIKNSRNIYVFADKTNNVYRMPTFEHNKLLKENVTKTYKKAPEKLQKLTNLEAKSINPSCRFDLTHVDLTHPKTNLRKSVKLF